MGKRKQAKEQYKSDIPEKSFTAYIIKGNRQIIKREITASKRFKVEDDTYRVKDDCIFYKNIEGKFQSVSYYREGNPNPYNFKGTNIGIGSEELDRFFAEDFYNIIVAIQPENRAIYIFIITIFNLILCLMFMTFVLFREFLF